VLVRWGSRPRHPQHPLTTPFLQSIPSTPSITKCFVQYPSGSMCIHGL
jgi:hypothetical protein